MATTADDRISNQSSPVHQGAGGGQEVMVVMTDGSKGGRPVTVLQKSDSDDSRSTPSNSAKNSPAHTPFKLAALSPMKSIPVIRPGAAMKGKASQEQVELRRLRTECRLLQQRIDNLEKEMTTMGKRLIQKQVKITKQEEELCSLRTTLGKPSPPADSLMSPTEPEPPSSLKMSAPNQNGATAAPPLSPEVAASMVIRSDKEENVSRLHRRIAELDQREADACDTIRQLNEKISELETLNEQLSEPQSVELLSIQDELVACKLREAESNLALKELQQNVARLEKHWQKFLDEKQQTDSSQQSQAAGSQAEQLVKELQQRDQQLREVVMGLRLRETHLVSERNEIKQKLMELETQNHIYERQIKRQETEIGELKEKMFRAGQQEDDLNNTIKELERRKADLETKLKEEGMMSKIREAEYSQSAAVMRRRIAELEIENQELRTSAELQNRETYLKELEIRIQSLHEQLQNLAQVNHSTTSDGSTNQNPAQFEFTDDMTASFYNDLQMFSNPASFDFLATPPSFSDALGEEFLIEEPHTPTPYYNSFFLHSDETGDSSTVDKNELQQSSRES